MAHGRELRLNGEQVAVVCDTEDAQHLVEHLAVLAGHGHRALGLMQARLQFVDEVAHLDSTWLVQKTSIYFF